MKNDYEIRGEVTAIFLHHRGKRYETIIDTEDLPKAQSFPNTWFMNYHPDIDDYYITGRMIRDRIPQYFRLHRLVMGTPDDIVVDHINHKTMDNRRSVNLRNVTDDENKQNRLHKNGIRGVKWDKRINKWAVTVSINKETLNFGYHESYDEAVEISKIARAKYHPFSLEAKQGFSTDGISPFERKKADKLSGVKGVTWHEYSQKWRVRTNVNGKMTIIGSYEELSKAIHKLRDYKNEQKKLS